MRIRSLRHATLEAINHRPPSRRELGEDLEHEGLLGRGESPTDDITLVVPWTTWEEPC